jgi:hypothetical protein
MSEKQPGEVEAMVKERRNELVEAWNRHKESELINTT